MSTTLHIPPGSNVELLAGDGWVVHVRPPAARSLMAALLTHDADVSWPDDEGVAKANAVLRTGAPIMLSFLTKADAEACQARLVRGMRQ